jgi:hypothetical protein
MLLVLAFVIQTLLISDCLLRRLLQVFLPCRVSRLERYANANLLSTLAAACFNAATLPLQALASLLAALNRYVGLLLLFSVVFAMLLVLSPNAVHAYSTVARVYNLSATPFLAALRVVFILLDVVWRAVTPLFNGAVFFSSEIVKRIVVPLSRELAGDLAEMLQLLALALGALARAVLVWGENVWNCTGGFEARARRCGGPAPFGPSGPSGAPFANASAGAPSNDSFFGADCGAVFAAADTRCYASGAHLQLDLVTPGLYVRAAARVLQGALVERCAGPALVLNIAIFPLTDYQIYLAGHAFANVLLQGVVGLPVQTLRRCEAARGRARLGDVAKHVACTPDFEPLFDLATTALQSLGLAADAWLNFLVLQLRAALEGRAPTCNGERVDAAHAVQLRLEDVVLDAARAIEGRTHADLELLASRGGLPRSETLAKVRVVGLTSRLLAVTDGENVLYRSVYDGAVFAYGAFPFPVDVRAGLAAVPYATSDVGEADPFGDRSTGLLGCACRDSAAGVVLHCATAPYVSHVEDDEAAFNASAAHRVRFPGLTLAGMTCATTVVRVLAMRWPRRRLARAGRHGEGVSSGGYSGYSRPSLVQAGRDWRDFFTGDEDAVDSLRAHANVRRTARAAGVVAGIYVTPTCGGDAGGGPAGGGPAGGRAALRCGAVDDNCFPYCLGLVRAGLRSQNITMHNAKRWAESVVLPETDCGVGRDRGGACGAEGSDDDVIESSGALVELGGALRRGRCAAACVQSAAASSVVAIAALAGGGPGDDALSLLQQHNAVFGAVRTRRHPVVVAGDTMLVVAAHDAADAFADAGGRDRLVVVRLYDVGQSSMQLAAERLTSTANAHAASVAVCDTHADARCVAAAMAQGAVVLPPSFLQVGVAGAQATGFVMPAASSRFAVHFAANPEKAVFQAYFDYCSSGAAQTAFFVSSSYGRARVWTVQTTRAVDLEGAGAPSAAEVASRVSYMRVPDFFEPSTADGGGALCDVIVGLQIVGVEYLNAENVLVTVLAGRPRDYDPQLGDLTGPRHYRYYFLHPQRHDCAEATEGPGRDFTCWRAESAGQFPDDRVVSDAVGSGLCPEQRALPAFGTAAVLPLVAAAAALETLLDSVCALTAAVVARPDNPAAAVLELRTLDLRELSFHGMVDSGGARLLDVDPFIGAMNWLSHFSAGLMIFAADAFISVTGLDSAGRVGEKTAGGLRTLVVGTARVRAGSPLEVAPFAQVEQLFRAPLEQASAQASVAVLTSTEGVAGFTLPGAVRLFARAQIGMVSQAELVLRLGRAVAMRLLEANAAALDHEGSSSGPGAAMRAAGGIVGSALVDARGLIESAFLDTMRSQCHGLALSLGQEGALGQAVFHACMVLPDALEGCLSTFAVFVSEYPAAQCVCKLGQGEFAVLSRKASALGRHCLGRENAAAQHAWMLELEFRTEAAGRNAACFAAMDGANARLRSAFDKMFRRLYMLGQHAGSAADGVLSSVTGETEACDAFDVSPYVLSIIPEPIDYFMHCSDTEDCRTRCYDDFSAFEAANRSLAARGGARPGVAEEVVLPVESLLFGVDDVAEGRAAPPFEVQDAAELSPAACAVVCGEGEAAAAEVFPNRCLALAGAGRDGGGLALPATAYYCLPIDMAQRVREWGAQPPPEQGYELQAASSAAGAAPEQLLALHLLSTWAPAAASPSFPRDAVLAVVRGEPQGLAQGGVRLLLLRAGFAVRAVLRTESHAEVVVPADELDEGSSSDAAPASFAEGWLSSIARVQVLPSGAATEAAIISVFGHRAYRHEGARRWRRACVRGELALAATGEMLSSAADAWRECAPPLPAAAYAAVEDYERESGGPRWDSAGTHFEVCVRARAPDVGDDSFSASDCAALVRVPHSLPAGGGRAQLEVRDPRSGAARKLPASSALLTTLGVDRAFGTYLDRGGGEHVRAAGLARVHYSSGAELAALRGGAAQTLGLLMTNGRDAGAWLHVCELALPSANATGALADARAGGGLRAETRVRVHVECSVQNCAACGQWPRANTSAPQAPERPLQLRELENTCYAAQVRAVRISFL